jgi:sulfur carrier protein
MTEENTPTNQITLVFRGKEHSLPGNLFVHQALKRIGLNTESYLVVRDGEVITEDQMLRPGDRIRIVPVISGGSSSQ